MPDMDGLEVVAEMRRLRGAPAGRVMMARRKVTSDCAVMRARCRREALEAEWRRLRPDGKLRPERGGHEAEVGKRREIDGLGSGNARGETILAGVQHMGRQLARVWIDEPEVRHVVARVQLTLPRAV